MALSNQMASPVASPTRGSWGYQHVQPAPAPVKIWTAKRIVPIIGLAAIPITVVSIHPDARGIWLGIVGQVALMLIAAKQWKSAK